MLWSPDSIEDSQCWRGHSASGDEQVPGPGARPLRQWDPPWPQDLWHGKERKSQCRAQCYLLGSHSEILTCILLPRVSRLVEVVSDQMNQDCLMGGQSVNWGMLNSLPSLLLWPSTLSSHRATSRGTQTCFGASIDTGWAFLGRLEAAVRRSDRPLYRPLSGGQLGAKL